MYIFSKIGEVKQSMFFIGSHKKIFRIKKLVLVQLEVKLKL